MNEQHGVRTYQRPELVEYGRLADLTLGQGGSRPDNFTGGGVPIQINNVCDPGSPAPNLACG